MSATYWLVWAVLSLANTAGVVATWRMLNRNRAFLAECQRHLDEASALACGCYACIGNKPAHDGTWLTVGMTRMIVCGLCGNKRCPHGTDHRNECTGSNEPEQAGSRYGGLS